MYRTRRFVAIGATSLALLLVGCGDDDGGSSGGDGGGGDFCDLASDADSDNSDIGELFRDADAEASDFDAAFDDFYGNAEDAIDEAPDAVKDDLEKSLEKFKELETLLKDADYDLDAVLSDSDNDDFFSDLDSISSDADEAIADECGDSDSGDDTTPDTPSDVTETSDSTDDGPTGDITEAQVDAIQQVFPRLSDDQATCLIEQGFDAASAGDQSAILAVLDDCNINITDLQP